MPSTTATPAAARRGLAGVRWVPTIFAMVCIGSSQPRRGTKQSNTFVQELICVLAGYGVAAYRRNQIENYLSRSTEFEKQDMDRRRRSTVLMDAYGDKSSLEDIERAMAIYESQQGSE